MGFWFCLWGIFGVLIILFFIVISFVLIYFWFRWLVSSKLFVGIGIVGFEVGGDGGCGSGLKIGIGFLIFLGL